MILNKKINIYFYNHMMNLMIKTGKKIKKELENAINVSNNK